jgi:hypothetical protein
MGFQKLHSQDVFLFYRQKVKGTLAMVPQPNAELKSWCTMVARSSLWGGFSNGQGHS